MSLTFSAKAYISLSRIKSKPRITAQGLFYNDNEFAKAHNLKTVKLYLVDNCLQDLKSPI